jgi:hypothetical protein
MRCRSPGCRCVPSVTSGICPAAIQHTTGIRQGQAGKEQGRAGRHGLEREVTDAAAVSGLASARALLRNPVGATIPLATW